jgi:hypothetical protein
MMNQHCIENEHGNTERSSLVHLFGQISSANNPSPMSGAVVGELAEALTIIHGLPTPTPAFLSPLVRAWAWFIGTLVPLNVP